MSLVHVSVTVVTFLALSLTAVFALIRVVRGPTILDRMIASDVLLTTLIMAVGFDMYLRKHTDMIALMIVIAATSVLATITVARFVRRRSAPDPQPTSVTENGDENG